MTIFGKLAYGAGLGVVTLLSIRFVAGSVGLAALGGLRAPAQPRPLIRRAFLLGAVVYALQSAALFTALQDIGASLAVLLLYTYPAFVLVGAAALGRERLSGAKLAALLLATGGIGLVLTAGEATAGGATGIVLGLLAGAGYAVYVLMADALLERAEPIALSTIVCAGAGTSFTLAAVVSGSLEWPQGSALLWLTGITLVSTVVAIASLFAGIKRVGPGTASIVSTVEPVFAVGLAFLIFDEKLSALQLAGAALVLAALMTISGGQQTKGASQCRTSG